MRTGIRSPPRADRRAEDRLGVILGGPAHLPGLRVSRRRRDDQRLPDLSPEYSLRIATSAARARDPPRLLRRDHVVRPSRALGPRPGSTERREGSTNGVSRINRIVSPKSSRVSPETRRSRRPQADPRDLGGEQKQSLTILPRRIRPPHPKQHPVGAALQRNVQVRAKAAALRGRERAPT